MGRTLLTATLRVQKFEQDWKIFARAPRQPDREAFAELCAFAHFHAAPLAHAASPYFFEMILLTMLIGLVQRAETLERQDVMRFYAPSPTTPAALSLFQTNIIALMASLRQRLSTQQQELYTFARALRRQDQQILRALLAATSSHSTRLPVPADVPSDEMLLTSLVKIMRRIRQLEKQYIESVGTIVDADEWSNACAIP